MATTTITVEEFIAEQKAIMDRCWRQFDEAMRNGIDADIDDDYFIAQGILEDLGIDPD